MAYADATIGMEGEAMLRAPILLGWFAVVIFVGSSVVADEPLYDEKADAHQQVTAALTEAAKTGKNIVLVYGANW
jgi:hypothetical protein